MESKDENMGEFSLLVPYGTVERFSLALKEITVVSSTKNILP